MKNQKIDLMEIGKIHTKAQLKKYHINTALLNDNYLFHYLILTNNLKGLKLYSHPIYRYNIDGLNGFMLAAKEKKFEILDYLIKNTKEKKLIYLKNKKNQNFIHYLNPEDPEYLTLIENNPKIKWDELFTQYSNSHLNGIDILFLRGKYATIKKIIEMFDFNYKSYISQPYHFNFLMNNNLSNDMVIKLLDLIESKEKDILSYVNDVGCDISYPIVLKDDIDLKLLKYIISKRGEQLDKYSPISGLHIFILAYKMGKKNNNYNAAQYILDNVMNNHNYEETDIRGNNIVHFLLQSRLTSKKGDYSIEKHIFNNEHG